MHYLYVNSYFFNLPDKQYELSTVCIQGELKVGTLLNPQFKNKWAPECFP